MAGGRTELDRWARALGTDNDTAVLLELARLRERLGKLATLAAGVEQMLKDTPDTELLAGVRAAKDDGVNLWGAVGVVERRFKAHERGDQ